MAHSHTLSNAAARTAQRKPANWKKINKWEWISMKFDIFGKFVVPRRWILLLCFWCQTLKSYVFQNTMTWMTEKDTAGVYFVLGFFCLFVFTFFSQTVTFMKSLVVRLDILYSSGQRRKDLKKSLQSKSISRLDDHLLRSRGD